MKQIETTLCSNNNDFSRWLINPPTSSRWYLSLSSIDEKLNKLGLKIDRNIIYMVLFNILGMINLIRPELMDDIMPKILPVEKGLPNLIIPLILLYVFIRLGYLKLKYFKKREQLSDFLKDYGEENKLSESKLLRVLKVFRPTTLGETFYTYYRYLYNKNREENQDLNTDFTVWIYFVFTASVSFLMAFNNALIFYYCWSFLNINWLLIALPVLTVILFICYYDFGKRTEEITGNKGFMTKAVWVNVFVLALFCLVIGRVVLG